MKKKFDAVLVVVAATDEVFCSDFTNSVHMMALKTNTRPKQMTLKHKAACKEQIARH